MTDYETQLKEKYQESLNTIAQEELIKLKKEEFSKMFIAKTKFYRDHPECNPFISRGGLKDISEEHQDGVDWTAFDKELFTTNNN